MKKILVTGATGFIGNYVIEELLKQNCSVIATSSNIDGAANASWYHQVKYIPFNFREFNNDINYFSFFAEPDAMIHLAWEGLPNYKEAFHVEENLPRHFALLQNLIRYGLTNLTVTGTCLEYGMLEGRLFEDMASEPSNPYAVAKYELCKQVSALRQQFSFSFKWIRLFYMYGQGQSIKSLISQLETALDNNEREFNMSGGKQVRDFLPVEKVAVNIVKIASQNKVDGIINCCSGEPVSVRQFVENYLAARKRNTKLNLGFYPYTDYEPMEFWGDTNKLKSIINND